MALQKNEFDAATTTLLDTLVDLKFIGHATDCQLRKIAVAQHSGGISPETSLRRQGSKQYNGNFVAALNPRSFQNHSF